MGAPAKTLDRTQDDASQALADIAEWEAKAAAARDEAATVEAESSARILADPSQAEKVSLRVATLERTSRAYDDAVTEARGRLRDAQCRLLEVEANDEDRKAQAADKKLADHESKVAALLSQLKELNGADYEVSYQLNSTTGQPSGYRQYTKAGPLEDVKRQHVFRAALIRFYLATGRTPSTMWELNDVTGTTFNTMVWDLNQFPYPESVLAARTAGLVTPADNEPTT